MRTISVVVLIHAFLFPVLSKADLHEYTVMRTTEKMVIDGILDEQDWARAKSTGPFTFPWWKEGEQEQTEVKMLWDDTFLYVSYTCDDKHIWAVHYDTNSTTYMDDCVELFWTPGPQTSDKYYMFEINCMGNRLSVYKGSGNSIHERISRIMVPHIAQTIRGTVNNDDNTDTGWIIELAIRFSDYTELSPDMKPSSGDVWRAGLNRCGGSTNAQDSQWSPEVGEEPSFHRPAYFGRIIFSDLPVR